MLARKIVRREIPTESDNLGDLHPVLRRVLKARGIHDSAQIHHSLGDLIPPSELLGIDTAAERLVLAIQQQESLLIVGDYDVDGATSTVVALQGLRALGALHVTYSVPNRFEYGYGLSTRMAEHVIELQPKVVITVDNGISSIDGVRLLKEAGISVVVTDHHLPGDVLPDADAIVNPNQPGCRFPSKALCGVGVMFYLLLAVREQLDRQEWFVSRKKPALADLLDLVALGTVADLVPLDHNNRILVAQGIARIRAGKTRPGIIALLDVAKRDYRQLVSADMGFAIGPRLNAAGRLTDISTGIECLLATDVDAANALARELNSINQERKEIEQGMQQEAIQAVKALNWNEFSKATSGLALYNPSWHEGVVGLVASRIKDRIGQPAIVFAPGEEGYLKGSGRSVAEVHIRDILAEIDAKQPGLIIRFGGHAMAAGLTIKVDDFEAFASLFAETVQDTLGGAVIEPQVSSDGDLEMNDLNLDLAHLLRVALPWGQAFPAPLFDGEFKVLSQRLVGGIHLKLLLQPLTGSRATGKGVDAIAFRYAETPGETPRLDTIHAVYQLDVNEFRGQRSVQLIIEYLEPVEDTVH